MLVQIDGWSGSGKSVLMYLLDGHPEIYSHPFHDLIQFLFRDEFWNEEWVKEKDVRGLRTDLANHTQYFLTESFFRQGKYVIEYSSDNHLEYQLPYSFGTIDNLIIDNLINKIVWTPEVIVEEFYRGFINHIYPDNKKIRHTAFMGGWQGLDNQNTFSQIYPHSKRILVTRDIKDIIAVKTGRKPIEIDFRSNSHNKRTVDDMIMGNEIFECSEFYKKYEHLAKSDPTNTLVVDLDDLINAKKKTMMRICDFLKISFTDSLLNATFFGNLISQNGVNYADQILDKYEDILDQQKIDIIDMEIARVKVEAKPLSVKPKGVFFLISSLLLIISRLLQSISFRLNKIVESLKPE